MRLYAGSPYDLDRALAEAPTARDAARRMMVAAAEVFTGALTPRGCLLASATASGSSEAADVQAEVAQVRRTVDAVAGGIAAQGEPAPKRERSAGG